MSDPDPWSWLSTDLVRNVTGIIAALVTFLAVLVALLKDWFWDKIRKPKLEMAFEMAPPFCIKTEIMNSFTRVRNESFYFRLRIVNSGSRPARNVQVNVVEQEIKMPTGAWKRDERFIPMNLKWSNSMPGVNPEIFAELISPKMTKYADFGHIVDPAFRAAQPLVPGLMIPNDPETFLFEIDYEVQPLVGSHLLKANEYRFEIVVVAENCAPKNYYLELNFRGMWYSAEKDMYEKSIGVSIKKKN